MLVEEYIQIAKDEFPYLFEEYGFKVVYTEEGEGRDAFGLESDMYKMRIFFSQQGECNFLRALERFVGRQDNYIGFLSKEG